MISLLCCIQRRLDREAFWPSICDWDRWRCCWGDVATAVCSCMAACTPTPWGRVMSVYLPPCLPLPAFACLCLHLPACVPVYLCTCVPVSLSSTTVCLSTLTYCVVPFLSCARWVPLPGPAGTGKRVDSVQQWVKELQTFHDQEVTA